MRASLTGSGSVKAQRLRYKNGDMADLAAKLEEAGDARFRLIATDGVFSMDGYLANLPGICELADEHDALVMVDDSHAVGFVGPRGRGTHEHHGVMERVDILTGTLGKALGGAQRGLYVGAAGDHRIIATTVPAVFILEYGRAADCGGEPEGIGVAVSFNGAARPAGGEHGVFPRANRRARI